MRPIAIAVVAAALGAVLLSGCSDPDTNPVGPRARAMSASVLDAALETDRMVDEAVSDESDAMGAVAAATDVAAATTTERSFRRTRTCPAGGSFEIEGSMLRTADRETGTIEIDAGGGSAATGCAFERGDLLVTLDGASEWEVHRRRVDGLPDGPQTSRHAGAWRAVRSDGEQRACRYEITVVRDADTRTRTVEGTVCGDFVRRVERWSPGA